MLKNKFMVLIIVMAAFIFSDAFAKKKAGKKGAKKAENKIEFEACCENPDAAKVPAKFASADKTDKCQAATNVKNKKTKVGKKWEPKKCPEPQPVEEPSEDDFNEFEEDGEF